MRTGTCERCGNPFTDTTTNARRRFCSENCRKRHQERTTGRGVCAKCGGPTARKRAYRYCRECRAQLETDRVAARAEQIVAWWAEGRTLSQIGELLGWTQNHAHVEINRLRRAGYDLPFRRSDADVESIRTASRQWHAERRAA